MIDREIIAKMAVKYIHEKAPFSKEA